MAVVDDEEGMRDILRIVLEKDNKEVVSSGNGREMIYMLLGMKEREERLPDVILLDPRMPVMDGSHFLRALRNNDDLKQFSNIPVILCSGSIFEDDEKNEAEDWKVADAWSKAFFNKGLLLNKINSVLEHNQSGRLAEQTDGGESIAQFFELMDITIYVKEWERFADRDDAKDYPNLEIVRIIDKDKEFDCIAWTFMVTDECMANHRNSLDSLYKANFGYIRVATEREAEIAVYEIEVEQDGKKTMKVTHAARRFSTYWWGSKMGEYHLVLHTLDELRGGVYGKVTRFYGPAKTDGGIILAIGAQDVSIKKGTGQIPAQNLVDRKVDFCMAGHPDQHESAKVANKKVKALLNAGLIPIIFVYDTLAERKQKLTDVVLKKQLKTILKGITAEQAEQIFIVYLPLWVKELEPSRQKAMNSREVQKIFYSLRNWLAEKYGPGTAERIYLIHGRLVNDRNVGRYMSLTGIDGVFVFTSATPARKAARITVGASKYSSSKTPIVIFNLKDSGYEEDACIMSYAMILEEKTRNAFETIVVVCPDFLDLGDLDYGRQIINDKKQKASGDKENSQCAICAEGAASRDGGDRMAPVLLSDTEGKIKEIMVFCDALHFSEFASDTYPRIRQTIKSFDPGVRFVIWHSAEADDLIRRQLFGLKEKYERIDIVRVRGSLSPWANDCLYILENRKLMFVPEGFGTRYGSQAIYYSDYLWNKGYERVSNREIESISPANVIVGDKFVFVGLEHRPGVEAWRWRKEQQFNVFFEDSGFNTGFQKIAGDREVVCADLSEIKWDLDMWVTYLNDQTVKIADIADFLRIPHINPLLQKAGVSKIELINLEHSLDQAAISFKKLGFKVERITASFLPLGDRLIPLSYNNVRLETLPEKRVYMPVYDDFTVDSFNRETLFPFIDLSNVQAADCYKSSGYKVIPVSNMETSVTSGGAFCCTTKVLSRSFDGKADGGSKDAPGRYINVSTELTDSDDPGLIARTREIVDQAQAKTDAQKVAAIIRSTRALPYQFHPWDVKASAVLECGMCGNKSNRAVAMCRIEGIPARFKQIDMFREALKNTVLQAYYHKIFPVTRHYLIEVFIDGRWEEAEPDANVDAPVFGRAIREEFIPENPRQKVFASMEEIIEERKELDPDSLGEDNVFQALNSRFLDGKRKFGGIEDVAYPARTIGVAGLIGSAKTTVCGIVEMLALDAVKVIAMDGIGHAVQKEKEIKKNIIAEFGSGVLRYGMIDREKLGDIVFKDKKALRQLNKIMFPRMKEVALAELEQAHRAGKKIIVIEAAIITELGLDVFCDEIWLVEGKTALRRQRLAVRRRDADKIKNIELRQRPVLRELKKRKNVRPIDNNGTLDSLIDAVDEALRDTAFAPGSRADGGVYQTKNIIVRIETRLSAAEQRCGYLEQKINDLLAKTDESVSGNFRDLNEVSIKRCSLEGKWIIFAQSSQEELLAGAVIDHGIISGIAVEPDLRRKAGLGAIVLKESLIWAKESGLSSLKLFSTDKAVGFYRKFNYKLNNSAAIVITEKKNKDGAIMFNYELSGVDLELLKRTRNDYHGWLKRQIYDYARIRCKDGNRKPDGGKNRLAEKIISETRSRVSKQGEIVKWRFGQYGFEGEACLARYQLLMERLITETADRIELLGSEEIDFIHNYAEGLKSESYELKVVLESAVREVQERRSNLEPGVGGGIEEDGRADGGEYLLISLNGLSKDSVEYLFYLENSRKAKDYLTLVKGIVMWDINAYQQALRLRRIALRSLTEAGISAGDMFEEKVKVVSGILLNLLVEERDYPRLCGLVTYLAKESFAPLEVPVEALDKDNPLFHTFPVLQDNTTSHKYILELTGAQFIEGNIYSWERKNFELIRSRWMRTVTSSSSIIAVNKDGGEHAQGEEGKKVVKMASVSATQESGQDIPPFYPKTLQNVKEVKAGLRKLGIEPTAQNFAAASILVHLGVSITSDALSRLEAQIASNKLFLDNNGLSRIYAEYPQLLISPALEANVEFFESKGLHHLYIDRPYILLLPREIFLFPQSEINLKFLESKGLYFYLKNPYLLLFPILPQNLEYLDRKGLSRLYLEIPEILVFPDLEKNVEALESRDLRWLYLKYPYLLICPRVAQNLQYFDSKGLSRRYFENPEVLCLMPTNRGRPATRARQPATRNEPIPSQEAVVPEVLEDYGLPAYGKMCAVEAYIILSLSQGQRASWFEENFLKKARVFQAIACAVKTDNPDLPGKKRALRHIEKLNELAPKELRQIFHDLLRNSIYSSETKRFMEAYPDLLKNAEDRNKSTQPSDESALSASRRADGGKLSEKQKKLIYNVYYLILGYVVQERLVHIEDEDAAALWHRLGIETMDSGSLRRSFFCVNIQDITKILEKPMDDISSNVFVVATLLNLLRHDGREKPLQAFVTTELGREFEAKLGSFVINFEHWVAGDKKLRDERSFIAPLWVPFLAINFSFLTSLHVNRMIEQISGVLGKKPEDVSILNLGSNPVHPFTQRSLARKGYSFIVYEMDKRVAWLNKMLSALSGFAKREYMIGTAQNMRLDDNSLDFIVVGVSELDILEAKRVLKPDGIIIMTPFDFDHFHIIYEGLLRKAGFKILDTGHSVPISHTYIIAQKQENVKEGLIFGYQGVIENPELTPGKVFEKQKLDLKILLIGYLLEMFPLYVVLSLMDLDSIWQYAPFLVFIPHMLLINSIPEIKIEKIKAAMERLGQYATDNKFLLYKGTLETEGDKIVFSPLDPIEEVNYDRIVEAARTAWGLPDLRVYFENKNALIYNYVRDLIFNRKEMYKPEKENIKPDALKKTRLNNDGVNIFADFVASGFILQWLGLRQKGTPALEQNMAAEFSQKLRLFHSGEITYVPDDYFYAGRIAVDSPVYKLEKISNGRTGIEAIYGLEYRIPHTTMWTDVPRERYKNFVLPDEEDRDWEIAVNKRTLPRFWLKGLVPDFWDFSLVENGRKHVLFTRETAAPYEEIREAELSNDGRTLLMIKNNSLEAMVLETFKVFFRLERKNAPGNAHLILNDENIGLKVYYRNADAIAFARLNSAVFAKKAEDLGIDIDKLSAFKQKDSEMFNILSGQYFRYFLMQLPAKNTNILAVDDGIFALAGADSFSSALLELKEMDGVYIFGPKAQSYKKYFSDRRIIAVNSQEDINPGDSRELIILTAASAQSLNIAFAKALYLTYSDENGKAERAFAYYLINLLTDGATAMRWKAAHELGKIRAKSAVDPLIASLKSSDLRLRGYAAKALGRIGDKKAILPLAEALISEPDCHEWSSMSYALSQLGLPRPWIEDLTALWYENYDRLRKTGRRGADGGSLTNFLGKSIGSLKMLISPGKHFVEEWHISRGKRLSAEVDFYLNNDCIATWTIEFMPQGVCGYTCHLDVFYRRPGSSILRRVFARIYEIGDVLDMNPKWVFAYMNKRKNEPYEELDKIFTHLGFDSNVKYFPRIPPHIKDEELLFLFNQFIRSYHPGNVIKKFCWFKLLNEFVKESEAKLVKRGYEFYDPAVWERGRINNNYGFNAVQWRQGYSRIMHVNKVWNSLVQNGYIDRSGQVQEKFMLLRDASGMILHPDYEQKKEQVFEILKNAPLLARLKDSFPEIAQQIELNYRAHRDEHSQPRADGGSTKKYYGFVDLYYDRTNYGKLVKLYYEEYENSLRIRLRSKLFSYDTFKRLRQEFRINVTMDVMVDIHQLILERRVIEPDELAIRIEQFLEGIAGPIVVWKEEDRLWVQNGNHRVAAAYLLGIEQLPAIVLEPSISGCFKELTNPQGQDIVCLLGVRWEARSLLYLGSLYVETSPLPYLLQTENRLENKHSLPYHEAQLTYIDVAVLDQRIIAQLTTSLEPYRNELSLMVKEFMAQLSAQGIASDNPERVVAYLHAVISQEAFQDIWASTPFKRNDGQGVFLSISRVNEEKFRVKDPIAFDPQVTTRTIRFIAGGPCRVSPTQFCKDATRLWRLLSEHKEKKTPESLQALHEFMTLLKSREYHLVEGRSADLVEGTNMLQRCIPAESYGFIYFVIFHLAENILQHANNYGILLAKADKNQQKVNIAVMDDGPGFFGKEKPTIAYTPEGGFLRRPGSPGEGVALGQIYSISLNLEIFTRGHMWKKDDEEVRELREIEGIAGAMVVSTVDIKQSERNARKLPTTTAAPANKNSSQEKDGGKILRMREAEPTVAGKFASPSIFDGGSIYREFIADGGIRAGPGSENTPYETNPALNPIQNHTILADGGNLFTSKIMATQAKKYEVINPCVAKSFRTLAKSFEVLELYLAHLSEAGYYDGPIEAASLTEQGIRWNLSEEEIFRVLKRNKFKEMTLEFFKESMLMLQGKTDEEVILGILIQHFEDEYCRRVLPVLFAFFEKPLKADRGGETKKSDGGKEFIAQAASALEEISVSLRVFLKDYLSRSTELRNSMSACLKESVAQELREAQERAEETMALLEIAVRLIKKETAEDSLKEILDLLGRIKLNIELCGFERELAGEVRKISELEKKINLSEFPVEKARYSLRLSDGKAYSVLGRAMYAELGFDIEINCSHVSELSFEHGTPRFSFWNSLYLVLKLSREEMSRIRKVNSKPFKQSSELGFLRFYFAPVSGKNVVLVTTCQTERDWLDKPLRKRYENAEKILYLALEDYLLSLPEEYRPVAVCILGPDCLHRRAESNLAYDRSVGERIYSKIPAQLGYAHKICEEIDFLEFAKEFSCKQFMIRRLVPNEKNVFFHSLIRSINPKAQLTEEDISGDGGSKEKEEFMRITRGILDSLSKPELNPWVSPDAYDQAQEDLYYRRHEWAKFNGYARARKILVVVRDQFDRNTLSRFFRELGFQAVSFDNAQDGWEKFLEAKKINLAFDLVILEEAGFSPEAAALVQQINKETPIIFILEAYDNKEVKALLQDGFISQVVDKVALDTGIAIVYQFSSYLKEKYELDIGGKQGSRVIFRIPAGCLSFSSFFNRGLFEQGVKFQVEIADPGLKEGSPQPDILPVNELGMNELNNRFDQWVIGLGVSIAANYQSQYKKEDLSFLLEEALKNSWDAIVSFFDETLELEKPKGYSGFIDIFLQLPLFEGEEVVYVEVSDNGAGIGSADTDHKRVCNNCGIYKYYWGQRGQACIMSKEIVFDLWERWEFKEKLDGGTRREEGLKPDFGPRTILFYGNPQFKIPKFERRVKRLLVRKIRFKIIKFFLIKKISSKKKKVASEKREYQDKPSKSPEKIKISLELDNALNGLEFGSRIAQTITNQVESGLMVSSYI
ncbi:MAG: dephospho-CoA kinase [Candidatus Omnitrophica bacterium]|nr:dephospho-CoA kinase [Candidatus Omnitrophota bacterium]